MSTPRCRIEPLETRKLLSIGSVEPVGEWVESAPDEPLKKFFLPSTYQLKNLGGYLTAPDNSDALVIAQRFLAKALTELHLDKGDVSDLRLTSRYTDSDTGMTHLYLRQTIGETEVLGSDVGVHVTADGRVLTVGSSLLRGVGAAQSLPPAQISLSPAQAVAIAAQYLELPAEEPILGQSPTDLDAPQLSQDLIHPELGYVVADTPQMAWHFQLRLPAPSPDWYDLAVSASTGELLWAKNWTNSASYRVFAPPIVSPAAGSAVLVNNPADSLASPYGWHDTDGAVGDEYTTTIGNNVSAQEDSDGDNQGGSRPDGGAAMAFDFPFSATAEPSMYRPASTTNLFYLSNWMHDVNYRYGFTEAAGNFQTTNYGRGGAGGDAVIADTQDGSGMNNANFASPPDGYTPRMQMYLFNQSTPGRDGSVDDVIVLHEYAHGITSRLTGGPGVAGTLDTLQAGGMGEGWSDWWSLVLTMKASDTSTTRRPLANYVLGQTSSGKGIRRYPYSTDLNVCPLMLEMYGTGGSYYGIQKSLEVHDTGEIWSAMLWDMTWYLIDSYGFDANVGSGYSAPNGAGNKLAIKLVMEALKLQPANPTFAQARDALLLADQIVNNNADYWELWAAFANRGFGETMKCGASSSSATVQWSTEFPIDQPVVVESFPNRQSAAPFSSISFRFSQAMDTTSFSPLVDVTRFIIATPTIIDIKSSLTGYTWSADARTLTVQFTPQSTVGEYRMRIGPNILSATTHEPMDQTREGIPGDTNDYYWAFVPVSTRLGPDAGGYSAGAWAFENLDLSVSDPDVITKLENTDDNVFALPLGGNSMRFYSHLQTIGLAVSSNGTVSPSGLLFTPINTELDDPSDGFIAALWDDWITLRDDQDRVLYRFDDLNNDGQDDRVVIEWQDIPHFASSNDGTTFQAILQLNTGSRPGTILLNYVDVETDDPDFSNGKSATVGIKDYGVPSGGCKILVSQDDATHPWIGNHRAIRFSNDWIAPTGSGTFSASAPTSLKFSFSEDVSWNLRSSSLTLRNSETGEVIDPGSMSFTYTKLQNQATYSFAGFLPDGNYVATLPASAVSDASWMPLASDLSLSFTFLQADANHDRSVNTLDFNILAGNFGKASATFDEGNFNLDTTADSADFGVLLSQYGKRIAATAPVVQGAPAFIFSAMSMPSESLDLLE
jgi:extracellular elastinolytic metalloproteinase